MWKMHRLFRPGNFWPWFGRTEMRAAVLSCIPWRWENCRLRAWAVPPTGTPRYVLQSIQFINYFLLRWALTLCKKSDGFRGVVLPQPFTAFAFWMWFGLFSKIGNFPRMGENTVCLGWTSDMSRGRALEWEQDWIDSKPEQRLCLQCRSNCSLARAQRRSALFAPSEENICKQTDCIPQSPRV